LETIAFWLYYDDFRAISLGIHLLWFDDREKIFLVENGLVGCIPEITMISPFGWILGWNNGKL
jgi:hypothetical protein